MDHLKQLKKGILYTASLFLVAFFVQLITHQLTSANNAAQFVNITSVEDSVKQTAFPLQCIDTMKVSRDKARERHAISVLQKQISDQVRTIASLGANCIAIGTPYNDEFLPYLKLWVTEARKNNLRVWFRGNWAEWEGWFEYKKSLTPTQHIQKTKEFITSHPELFVDGDIFTPAPEAENGGPFHPLNSHQKTLQFRQFLIDEATESGKAFNVIGKRVTTNYLSMSGGVAKSVMTKAVTKDIGNTVTLDHYVASPAGMTEYLTYFHSTYNTHLVLGEFGAPIPDLNGQMTEDEQSAFVDKLFQVLFINRSFIDGVNYWTLSESSTALLNSNGTKRSVTAVLQSYYQPSLLRGTILNTEGNSVPNITVRTEDSKLRTRTNTKGQFSLLIPAKETKIVVDETASYAQTAFTVMPAPSETLQIELILKPQRLPLMYRIKSLLYKLAPVKNT